MLIFFFFLFIRLIILSSQSDKSDNGGTKKRVNNKVKSLMVLKGVKQVDICRKLHVTPQTVSLIVSGKKKSARIRAAIAKALGVKVEDLWPNGNNHKRAA